MLAFVFALVLFGVIVAAEECTHQAYKRREQD
jgi:hypothetical protein